MYDIDYSLPSVYICSHSSHRENWIKIRESGVAISSSWLDDPEVSAEKRLYEASYSQILIFYLEEDELIPESFYEVGAALAHGRVVIFCDEDNAEIELANHPKVQVMSVESALNLAREHQAETEAKRVSRIETYCKLSYRNGTRECEPEEADLISISSTKANIQSAILLPYPAAMEFASKICNHIDDGMVEVFRRCQNQ